MKIIIISVKERASSERIFGKIILIREHCDNYPEKLSLEIRSKLYIVKKKK